MSNLVLQSAEEPFLDDELKEVLSYCHRSTKVTAKTIFPDLFYTDFSDLHHQIFDLIDSGHQKIAIAAPRGIGKTTIARTLAARFILFRMAKFICYVMNSATVAEMQTENLKRELLRNSFVRQFFGNIKEDISDSVTYTGMGEEFSKIAWTAFGESFILPRGVGQQIRGLNWDSNRPELIIVDDLENKKEIRSEANREALKTWFFSDLMKSVDRYSNNWVIVYIDTLKHEDSLLADLLESPDWTSLKLSVCTEDLKSNVPEYMTDEEIRLEYMEHERKGRLDEFYSEYMNEPISLKDACWKPTSFKPYSEADPEFIAQLVDMETILIVDPAKTVKLQSAESAIVIIGINLKLSRYYVRKVISEKFYPNELYDAIFGAAQDFNVFVGGIEVTSLHEFIVQPLKQEMFKRNVYFELVELKAIASKEERASTVIPYYTAGYVHHNSNDPGVKVLESQQLSYPKPKRWDALDCVSYLPKMLEIGNRYFTPDTDDSDDPEAEFAELEASYEKPLEGWRAA